MSTCLGVWTTLMVRNSHVAIYGKPSGSHLPAGSLVSTESTCRTPGPEGLFFFSASSPAGVYGSGLAIPVSSSRPPSAPRPPGSSAGCSLAPLTPSVCAASQMPDMSRRGAGPLDFLPSYADRRGGTLFHLSSCARRRGEMIPVATTVMTEKTRRLDISEPSSPYSDSLNSLPLITMRPLISPTGCPFFARLISRLTSSPGLKVALVQPLLAWVTGFHASSTQFVMVPLSSLASTFTST